MFQLRPIRPDDEQFLYDVYASTREDELAQVDWDREQKDQFLRMQFDAQHSHYLQFFPDADFQLILKGDDPIGRLYIERRSDEIRIIDIAVLPAYQRKGAASQLFESILDEARESNLPVRIHVEKYNPALHWYQRLGFRQIEEQPVYLLMEWSA